MQIAAHFAPGRSRTLLHRSLRLLARRAQLVEFASADDGQAWSAMGVARKYGRNGVFVAILTARCAQRIALLDKPAVAPGEMLGMNQVFAAVGLEAVCRNRLNCQRASMCLNIF